MEASGYGSDIASGIKNEHVVYDYVSHSLKREEAIELLNVIDKRDLRGLRDYCIINLMLNNGLRSIEVTRINIEDLTEDRENKKYLLKIQGKGKAFKEDLIVLRKNVYEPILKLIKKMKRETGPLFTSISNNSKGSRLSTYSLRTIVKGYLKKIGLDYPSHSLRHTMAVLLLENDTNVYDVMTRLRHSKIETTMIYLKSIQRKRMLEDRSGKLLSELLEEN